jgi:hypothetical protein
MIKSLLDDKRSATVLSCIIGFGFALMFRRVCYGNQCIVIKGPPTDKTKNSVYQTNDMCVQYKPYAVQCTKK